MGRRGSVRGEQVVDVGEAPGIDQGEADRGAQQRPGAKQRFVGQHRAVAIDELASIDADEQPDHGRVRVRREPQDVMVVVGPEVDLLGEPAVRLRRVAREPVGEREACGRRATIADVAATRGVADRGVEQLGPARFTRSEQHARQAKSGEVLVRAHPVGQSDCVPRTSQRRPSVEGDAGVEDRGSGEDERLFWATRSCEVGECHVHQTSALVRVAREPRGAGGHPS